VVSRCFGATLDADSAALVEAESLLAESGAPEQIRAIYRGRVESHDFGPRVLDQK